MTVREWGGHLAVEVVDGVATVVIDRRDRLNALNGRLIEDLSKATDWLASADEVRGVVLTGAGDRAFAAGADIEEMRALDPESARALSRRGQECFLGIERLGKPVVAAVRGYALGGGCELALACHFRICSDDAQFGLPEVGLGLIPGFGGTVRLPRIVGIGRAIEIICSGRRVDAEESLRIGLVSEVVPATELLERATGSVRSILDQAPIAVTAAIRSVYHALGASVEDAMEGEAELFGSLAGTEDMKEGVNAFLEKRRPDFHGR